MVYELPLEKIYICSIRLSRFNIIYWFFMTNIRNLFVVWAELLLGLNLCAQNTPFDCIPFELGTDHWVYVSCRVNGSAQLRFLFDTGGYRSGDRPQYSICWTPAAFRFLAAFCHIRITSSDTNSGRIGRSGSVRGYGFCTYSRCVSHGGFRRSKQFRDGRSGGEQFFLNAFIWFVISLTNMFIYPRTIYCILRFLIFWFAEFDTGIIDFPFLFPVFCSFFSMGRSWENVYAPIGLIF